MIAETSINDVLLVLAGGTMGILGTLLMFFFTRSQRSAERIREAYVEYIAATETMLRTFVTHATAYSTEKPSEEVLAQQFHWLEKSEEAKTRQAAAYFRVRLCDKNQQRRAIARQMQDEAGKASKLIEGESIGEGLGVWRTARKALEEMTQKLEGKFSW